MADEQDNVNGVLIECAQIVRYVHMIRNSIGMPVFDCNSANLFNIENWKKEE